MEIGISIIAFLVQVLVSAVLLWFAMKLTKEEGGFPALLGAASIAALFDIVPYVGGLLSFIVLLVLISRWTTAEIWPDAALMVVVAWGLGALATVGLRMAFV